MKINITLQVEVDPEEWRSTYGGIDDVRADVRSYIFGLVYGSPGIGESEAKVTLKD